MEIIVNYWAIIVATIIHFVLGMIWFGPLFGKRWIEATGLGHMSAEDQKSMQKAMMPFYLLTIILSLLTNYILYHFVKGWNDVHGVVAAFWIWLGFMLPLHVGSVLWENVPKGKRWLKFWVQAPYYLITVLVSGYIFTIW